MWSNEPKATILIVEDQIIIAADLESRLERLGYTVRGKASTGREALELVERYKPDLVMMDITLQGEVDGLEAAAAIRANWVIPVVFITDYTDADQLVKDAEGRLIMANKAVLAVARDISDRKQTEAALRESEEKYRTLFENMEQGVFCQQADGTLFDVNDSALRMFGMTRDQFLGKTSLDPHWDVIHEDGSLFPGDQHPSMMALKTGKPVRDVVAGILNYKTGAYVWVNINAIPHIKPGETKPSRVFVTIHDITARKQAVEELKRNEIEKEETIKILKRINESGSIDDLAKVVTESLRDMLGVEAAGLRLKDGHDFPYYETKGFPEKFVLAERYLCTRDKDGRLLRDVSGNPILECMCGNVIKGRFDSNQPIFTERGSFWTNSTTDLLATTTDADRMARTRNRCNGEGYESVALIPLRLGNETYGLIQLNDPEKNHFSIHKIHMAEGIADHIAIAIAKKIEEDKVRSVLNEKNILLQEVHHRVRNNMQVIISLLNLQSNTFSDERLKATILESQNRIYAMAAIHEVLHRSSRLADVDLAQYLIMLSETALQNYKTYHGDINLTTDIEQIEVSLEKAYPIGLVFNELLSNAMKYAFPDGRSGKIGITGEMDKTGKIILSFSDDGVGLPSHVDWRNVDSLGISLVRNLVEGQLNGEIRLAESRGVRWEISFSI